MRFQRTVIGALFLLAIATHDVRADFVTICGGPTYDEVTGTGARFTGDTTVSTSGVAFASGVKVVNGTNRGNRLWRWDASGAAAVEMGNLGTSSTGFSTVQAYDVSANGIAVGYATKYVSNSSVGFRAVRWDVGDTVATELGHIGTNSSGITNAFARGVSTTGIVVGNATKYSGSTDLGSRAVRWNAGGTIATELGPLGVNLAGRAFAEASGVNSSGVTIGDSNRYSGDTSLGSRPVRWDAGSTSATELGHLGTNLSGVVDGYTIDLNSTGAIIGSVAKYDGNTYLGGRAVRWDAGSTTAVELGNLGTDSLGKTSTVPFDIDEAGNIVGYAEKFSSGTSLGRRAVRWLAGQTVATELASLSTNNAGFTNVSPREALPDGTIVGMASKYDGNTLLGDRAVMWRPDGTIIDLNTLIDPAGGWTLNSADSIRETYFVGATGMFDPDSAGPLAAYQRSCLLDVRSVVPEPTALLALLAGLSIVLRHRASRGRCKRRG